MQALGLIISIISTFELSVPWLSLVDKMLAVLWHSITFLARILKSGLEAIRAPWSMNHLFVEYMFQMGHQSTHMFLQFDKYILKLGQIPSLPPQITFIIFAIFLFPVWMWSNPISVQCRPDYALQLISITIINVQGVIRVPSKSWAVQSPVRLAPTHAIRNSRIIVALLQCPRSHLRTLAKPPFPTSTSSSLLPSPEFFLSWKQLHLVWSWLQDH